MVRRLFPAFPDGCPGLGLLLLRVAVGVIAITQGAVHLADASSVTLASSITSCLTIASGAAVLVGFFTPCTGGVLALTGVLLWFQVRPEGRLLDRTSALLIVIDAAAIAFLGPGAFSVDARLFGRREILFPHDSHSSNS